MLLLTQRPTSESIPRTGTFVMPGGARKLKAPKLMVVQLVGELCSAADARSAMSRSGETMSNEVRIVCLTTQAQRPGPRDAWIATWTRWPGSLQRMVRPSCAHAVDRACGNTTSEADMQRLASQHRQAKAQATCCGVTLAHGNRLT